MGTHRIAQGCRSSLRTVRPSLRAPGDEGIFWVPLAFLVIERQHSMVMVIASHPLYFDLRCSALHLKSAFSTVAGVAPFTPRCLKTSATRSYAVGVCGSRRSRLIIRFSRSLARRSNPWIASPNRDISLRGLFRLRMGEGPASALATTRPNCLARSSSAIWPTSRASKQSRHIRSNGSFPFAYHASQQSIK